MTTASSPVDPDVVGPAHEPRKPSLETGRSYGGGATSWDGNPRQTVGRWHPGEQSCWTVGGQRRRPLVFPQPTFGKCRPSRLVPISQVSVRNVGWDGGRIYNGGPARVLSLSNAMLACVHVSFGTAPTIGTDSEEIWAEAVWRAAGERWTAVIW
jgi:hypothetical protein